jgi:hypothetical protein
MKLTPIHMALIGGGLYLAYKHGYLNKLKGVI